MYQMSQKVQKLAFLMNMSISIGLGVNTWTWIKLLDSDWFCYNQADMLLEKSENLLEFSVKQLIIQSRLASSIFRGQAIFGMWKTKCKSFL